MSGHKISCKKQGLFRKQRSEYANYIELILYIYAMSKEDLIAENEALKAKLVAMSNELSMTAFQLQQLQKLIFGSRRERFISDHSDIQLNLFADPEEAVRPAEAPTEEVTVKRKKRNKNHPGRNTFPDHFPVKEEILNPEGDVSDMKRIGEEVTDIVEYTPARLYIRRIIRPKYVPAEGEGKVMIADLPARAIHKGIAGSSLLAFLIVSKFVDHMPFYRLRQRLIRENQWDVSPSTMNDWFVAVCTLMKPLYDHMRKKVLESGYIQADESYIKVQDGKKKSTHDGYQWVFHAVEDDIVLFNYHKGRDEKGATIFLKNYRGWLQADGYSVYDKLGRKEGVELVGCHVHARRKFFEARDYDRERADYALNVYQQLYALEKECKGMSDEERRQYRDHHSRPLLESFKGWLDEQALLILPKSPIATAVRYSIRQWPKLIRILEDGRLEMDNNLIENKIRPLALGRKNYLFAGNHKAAQRIAMIYSFFATCKAREVDPYEWLKSTMDRIAAEPEIDMEDLMPKKIVPAQTIP